MPQEKNKQKLTKSLKSMWDTASSTNNILYLTNISILEGEKLRGLSDSSLDLNFPITVITGGNGTGKTTFLTLALLGFHATNGVQLATGERLNFFHFPYFFKTSPQDKHKQGIKIAWAYSDQQKLQITKGKERWLRYKNKDGSPRRPAKGTEYSGIFRAVPAFEKKGYKNYFGGKARARNKNQDHGQELKNYMVQIMKKPYERLTCTTHANSTGNHKLTTYNESHSSFNAGAGEDALVNLLETLLNAPEQSIIAIEEIEIGLHPSILKNLAKVILQITLKRKLQLLISSHSPEFLRAIPNECLVLAKRSEGRVDFYNNVDAEYAIASIGGQGNKSRYIVCEDQTAAQLIKALLSNEERQQIEIFGYGSESELLQKAQTISNLIEKLPNKPKIVVVFDGDVQDSRVKDCIKEGFLSCKLPGNSSPEQYFLSKLQQDSGKNFLKESFSLADGDLTNLLNAITSLQDIHGLFYEISQHTNTEVEIVQNKIIFFIADNFKDDFNDIINSIFA